MHAHILRSFLHFKTSSAPQNKIMGFQERSNEGECRRCNQSLPSKCQMEGGLSHSLVNWSYEGFRRLRYFTGFGKAGGSCHFHPPHAVAIVSVKVYLAAARRWSSLPGLPLMQNAKKTVRKTQEKRCPKTWKKRQTKCRKNSRNQNVKKTLWGFFFTLSGCHGLPELK